LVNDTARAGLERRSILVTGASSGIGRACAALLDQSGFRVFASVRKAADAEALLLQSASIVPLELDVTDPLSIGAAVDRVRAELGGRGLDGLVNNAGTGVSGPIEYTSLAMLRAELEVNVIGQIAVTQGFLPLIRQAHGRIVNMGSVGGRISIPFGGVLCACKSAFGSMTDALRMELHPFGIHVSLVEPAAIRTPAVDKTLGDVEKIIRALPSEGETRYGDMLREFTRRAYRREQLGSSPEVVARVVHEALTAQNPRARYLVGKHAHLLGTMPRLFPDGLLDRIRFRLFGMPDQFGSLPANAHAGTA
jgi:NAD(P)-dependent dehydrogenase (short-subunit alcohol dehydrogenase family)